MNSLFGVELPTPVNFIIAFIVVLVLIGAAAWIVRKFGVARLEAGARNRQPRLAVVDSAAVDGRRKLVIIRRDNVEHLLMIGGPTDVVVETSIVRGGAAASREPQVRVGNADNLPRAMPLPEATAWPLAPEPAAAPALRAEPAYRAEPTLRAERTHAPTETPAVTPRPPRNIDTLAGLAAELSRPAPEAAPAPRVTAEPPARAPAAAQPAAHSEQPAPAAAVDPNLADMAQRLEAALRRPMPPGGSSGKPEAAAARPATDGKRSEPKAPRAEVQRTAPAVTPQSRNGQSHGQSPGQPHTQPAQQSAAQPSGQPKQAPPPPAAQPQKPLYDSLEQEMASLLGRPTSGKT